jgi:hypothetical protein
MPTEVQQFNEIPTKIEITLYRYNHIDGMILACLRRDADLRYGKKYETKFEVPAEEVKRILNKNERLRKELVRFKEMKFVEPTDVNSIFFLNAMMTNYPNLDSFIVVVNKDKSFSRLIETEDRKIIAFNHRVLEGKIDVTQGRSIEEIRLFNEVLTKMGLLTNKRKNFINIDAADLVEELVKFEENDEFAIDGKYAPVFSAFFSWIEEKVEEDNSALILVTDFV